MVKKLVATGQVRLKDDEINNILDAISAVSVKSRLKWVLVSLFGSRVDLSKKGGDIDLYFKMAGSLERDEIYSLKNMLRTELCERLGEQKFDIVIDSDSQNSSFIQSVVLPEKVDLWLNQ